MKPLEKGSCSLIRLSVCTMFLAASAVAQNTTSETVGAGRGEVFGLAGLYFGEGLKTPAYGGGAAYTVSRHLRLFGELSHIRDPIDLGTDISISALLFQGGAHILFPLGSSPVVPFASAGIGGFRVKGSSGGISASETEGQFSFGGGIDYNITRKFGIRPMFTVYNLSEYRASVGVFFRF